MVVWGLIHLLINNSFNLNDFPTDGGCVLVNYQKGSICLAQNGTGSLGDLRVLDWFVC